MEQTHYIFFSREKHNVVDISEVDSFSPYRFIMVVLSLRVDVVIVHRLGPWFQFRLTMFGHPRPYGERVRFVFLGFNCMAEHDASFMTFPGQ